MLNPEEFFLLNFKKEKKLHDDRTQMVRSILIIVDHLHRYGGNVLQYSIDLNQKIEKYRIKLEPTFKEDFITEWNVVEI